MSEHSHQHEPQVAADPDIEAMLDTYGETTRTGFSTPIAGAFVGKVRRRRTRRIAAGITAAATVLLVVGTGAFIALRGFAVPSRTSEPIAHGVNDPSHAADAPAWSILAMQQRLTAGGSGSALNAVEGPVSNDTSDHEIIRAGWAMSESKLGSLIAVR